MLVNGKYIILFSMKNQYQSLLLLLYCVTLIMVNISCSDNEVLEEPTRYSTTFRVYETNDDFPETNLTASRFVSEGAIVTIWELNDHNGYDVVKYLKTNLDGTTVYNHNSEILFYSVEKNIQSTNMEFSDSKRNLAILTLKDEKGKNISSIQFQVEGVFTSQQEIDSHAKFNFGVDSTQYTPRIGSLKFKDINNDGFIDIEDSISRAMIDVWNGDEEEVYLSSAK